MNISSLLTKDYENVSNWKLGENKPNQTQFPKSQNECKLTYNKGLQKKRRFRSPKKQTQFKANLLDAQMNATSFITKEYENERLSRRGQNKSNKILIIFNSNGGSLDTIFPLRRRVGSEAKPKESTIVKALFISFLLKTYSHAKKLQDRLGSAISTICCVDLSGTESMSRHVTIYKFQRNYIKRLLPQTQPELPQKLPQNHILRTWR